MKLKITCILEVEIGSHFPRFTLLLLFLLVLVFFWFFFCVFLVFCGFFSGFFLGGGCVGLFDKFLFLVPRSPIHIKFELLLLLDLRLTRSKHA